MAKSKWECIGEHEFPIEADVLITDPCYLMHGVQSGNEISREGPEDWCKAHGLISTTFYGDWGCTVYRASRPVGGLRVSATKLGEFCADSGMVCVVGMDNVNERFPLMKKWIDEHHWCATVIRGFKGKVRFMTRKTVEKLENDVEYEDVELRVRGDGEIGGKKFSFESVQTSC